MSEKVLGVSGLTKRFGPVTAVEDASFFVQEGEIVGLLGPNGAGKTTTINIILGLIKPTAGRISVLGQDLATDRQEILKRVGFSSAYISMQSRLSVWENLVVFGYFYGVDRLDHRIDRLLAEFSMEHLKGRLYGSLSSGQRTRVNLVRALLHDPELLLLDEPTASLDPDIAQRVKEFLLNIRGRRKMSILYTSHNMEEVAQMCDRIIFLHHGRIVADDTPAALTQAIALSVLTIRFGGPVERISDLAKGNGLQFELRQPDLLTMELPADKIGEVLSSFALAGINLIDVEIAKPDLEDVFIRFARKGKDELAAG